MFFLQLDIGFGYTFSTQLSVTFSFFSWRCETLENKLSLGSNFLAFGFGIVEGTWAVMVIFDKLNQFARMLSIRFSLFLSEYQILVKCRNFWLYHSTYRPFDLHVSIVWAHIYSLTYGNGVYATILVITQRSIPSN